MQVDSLVRLISAKLASMMQQCQDVDRLRSLLSIENDFQPGVQDKLRDGLIGLWDTKDEERER